jgi:hypothetical protein
MSITAEDINLQKFLEKVAPASFPEAGKLTIPDVDFLQIASLLKISSALETLRQRIR